MRYSCLWIESMAVEGNGREWQDRGGSCRAVDTQLIRNAEYGIGEKETDRDRRKQMETDGEGGEWAGIRRERELGDTY